MDIQPPSSGLPLLGSMAGPLDPVVALGEASAVAQFVLRRLTCIEGIVQKIVAFAKFHPRIALKVLFVSIRAKAVYICQAFPSSVSAVCITKLDALFDTAVQSICEFSETEFQQVRARVHLPIDAGGLGFTPFSTLSPLFRLSTWLATIFTTFSKNDLFSFPISDKILQWDNPIRTELLDLYAKARVVNTSLPAQLVKFVENVQLDFCRSTSRKRFSPPWHKKLFTGVSAALLKSFQAAAPVSVKKWHQEIAAEWIYEPPPTTRAVSRDVWVVALRHHLLLPLEPVMTQRLHCQPIEFCTSPNSSGFTCTGASCNRSAGPGEKQKARLDPFGHHLLSCKCTGSKVRHDIIRDELRQVLRPFGAVSIEDWCPELSVPLSGDADAFSHARLDVVLRNRAGKALLDVMCTTGTMAAGVAHKRQKYHLTKPRPSAVTLGVPDKFAASLFVPAIVNTKGFVCKDFHDFQATFCKQSRGFVRRPHVALSTVAVYASAEQLIALYMRSAFVSTTPGYRQRAAVKPPTVRSTAAPASIDTEEVRPPDVHVDAVMPASTSDPAPDGTAQIGPTLSCADCKCTEPEVAFSAYHSNPGPTRVAAGHVVRCQACTKIHKRQSYGASVSAKKQRAAASSPASPDVTASPVSSPTPRKARQSPRDSEKQTPPRRAEAAPKAASTPAPPVVSTPARKRDLSADPLAPPLSLVTAPASPDVGETPSKRKRVEAQE